MEGDLSKIRTRRQLVAFAIPSILMMLFTSTYTLVDGLFVSNVVGTDALAALNITMPVTTAYTALGAMFSAGGVAYVNRKIGEGRVKEGCADFTLILITLLVLTLSITVGILASMDGLLTLMGADETLLPYAREYLTCLALFSAPLTFQYVFLQFMVAAGAPGLMLGLSVSAGLTNMMLDFLLIAVLDGGVSGAAIATCAAGVIPCAIGILFFTRSKESRIRFSRPSGNGHAIAKTLSNGASELMAESSNAVTTLLFNLVMMRMYGPDGVSAITIMLYIQFFAIAGVLGYSYGVAPLMAYGYGARDREVMHRLFSTSMTLVAVLSVIPFLTIELFGGVVVGIFASSSNAVMDLAVTGSRIFGVSFLLTGINLFASAFFTSLSNGLLSAMISFLRGLVLLAPLIVLLPALLGQGWIWAAPAISEGLTAVVTAWALKHYGPRYGYARDGSTGATPRRAEQRVAHRIGGTPRPKAGVKMFLRSRCRMMSARHALLLYTIRAAIAASTPAPTTVGTA